jgi:hypothetical protein
MSAVSSLIEKDHSHYLVSKQNSTVWSHISNKILSAGTRKHRTKSHDCNLTLSHTYKIEILEIQYIRLIISTRFQNDPPIPGGFPFVCCKINGGGLGLSKALGA